MNALSNEARQILEANLTERFKRLDELEAHVEGRQYDGRPSWWSGEAPAWDRKPCIRYSIIQNAIRDNVSLLAGESRFPRITSRPGESDVLDEGGLDPEKSALLDAHIRALSRVSRFRAHIRAQLRQAQGCGTAVGVFGVRNGKPFAETTKAKWCEPTVDPKTDEVVSLKIQYAFTKTVTDQMGREVQKVYLYRRIIDAKTDEEWEGEAKRKGEPKWVARRKPVVHGLGFCPVIWAPFLRECATHDQIDGQSIHDENTAELLQALDIALSQRHRAALFLEPQWTETGVKSGYNPTEPGRNAVVASTVSGGKVTPGNPANGVWVDAGPGGNRGRKKGPGHVWQYEDAAVKVQLHQANADALKAITDHCADLEAKLAEALAVVFLDPARMRFAASLSGRALKLLRQRQIDRADEIRDDFGVTYITPAMAMLLRIEAVCLAAKQAINVPGFRQVAAILASFLPLGVWTPPDLTLIWGPYAESDPTEEELTVKMVVESKGEIPRHARMQKLAPIFGIEDIAAALEQLDEETNDAAEKQRAAFEQQAATEADQFHKAAQKSAKGMNGKRGQAPDSDGEEPGDSESE